VLFPEERMAEMGTLAYQEMRTKTPASNDGRANDYVSCVANAIINANPELASQTWEITLFDGDQANAFALPGGKLGVYTGMLKVAENQAQLAAVVGHDLAHVVARPGNERVSANYASQSVLQVAAIAAGGGGAQNELFSLLGLGAQVGVLLPFGRAQESEADLLGLDYMARAGFRPSEASNLWRNMSKASGGSKQPAFLSTHPSAANRIEKLDARAPEAAKEAASARAAGRSPRCG
jgi:predicted Zn-dependent protease